MDTIYERCAGLDVHKKTVAACVRVWDHGRCVYEETRTYGTMTREIEELRSWLVSHGVTHVAMESTGVFWKPIYNLLEDHLTVLLCNARHVKQVPGRKTDRRDCQWLAELLQHGLLKGSFVPPRPQRELRELTRYRTQVVGERTRTVNRIQKELEDANIKLSSVATDILGASGRDMIEALIDGEEDPQALAELARKQLRGKIPQLREALKGKVTDHHRFMLKTLYEHVVCLEHEIATLDERIEAHLKSEELAKVTREAGALSYPEAVELLDTVPGVDQTAAQAIVAETGTDMKQFPTADNLSSWTGVSPGNNESAGKRRSGKTGDGNRWLKGKLFQCAWAATRTKGTYVAAAYRRWGTRRGQKKGTVAVGHSLLVSIYFMLTRKVPYEDLGPDHFDKLHPERQVRYHTRRLEELGYDVKLEAKPEAA